jgi:hypothetical protein
MKISESLFSVTIAKAELARVKELADKLFEAYNKTAVSPPEAVPGESAAEPKK